MMNKTGVLSLDALPGPSALLCLCSMTVHPNHFLLGGGAPVRLHLQAGGNSEAGVGKADRHRLITVLSLFKLSHIM